MKRILIMIITGIICAIIALIILNKKTLGKRAGSTFVEIERGMLEITVTNPGELIAERSTDIYGPEIAQSTSRGSGRQGQQTRGSNIRASALEIQDIVPEGTSVDEGDYIAQLDRTTYENTLKDELENLKTLQANLEIKILDTALVLTNLRDEIKNQKYTVEEAEIAYVNSKYENPSTIRKAKINLSKAQLTLEQAERSNDLKISQTLAEIKNEKMQLTKGSILVKDLEAFLEKFTITAPSSGMVMYKKDNNGNKRKVGSSVNPFDLVIATLPDLSSMISRTYVDEIEISKVKIGQKVNIKVDALPEKAFTGKVIGIANIGEQLTNSNGNVFEVQIRIDGSDPSLRPSMTTDNKIIIETFDDVVFIPIECVYAGSDSIPFVYKKNKTRQIVVLGKSNKKNVIVEQGLERGTSIYLTPTEESQKFKLVGEDLISKIKESE